MELEDILNNKEMAVAGKEAILTKTITEANMEITYHFNPIGSLEYQSVMENALKNVDLSELVDYANNLENPADLTIQQTKKAIEFLDFDDIVGVFDEILKRCMIVNKVNKQPFSSETFEDFKNKFPPSVRMKMGQLIVEESGLETRKPDINS